MEELEGRGGGVRLFKGEGVYIDFLRHGWLGMGRELILFAVTRLRVGLVVPTSEYT